MGNGSKKVVKLGVLTDVGTKKNGIKQFITNWQVINERIKLARQCGCQIEAISLQLQKMDLWLRILVNRKSGKKCKGKLTFGKLLGKAKEFLPPKLYGKISDFNDKRIMAIHHFVYGDGTYEEIKEIAKKHEDLHEEVMRFVLSDASKHGPWFQSLPEAEARV